MVYFFLCDSDHRMRKKDFEVIQRYLSLCDKLVDGEADLTMLIDADQKVPQTVVASDISNTNSLIAAIDQYESMATDDILQQLTCPSLLPPSAGCTLVTKVTDQKVDNCDNSTLLDLDQTCSDVTFYDEDNFDNTCKTETRLKGDMFSFESHETFLEDEKWKTVTSKLISQVTRDINSDCVYLNISNNPTKWSVSDVGKWITQMCFKYNITEINLDLFLVSGVELCGMTEHDFRWRCPAGRSDLFSELEVWKNAYRFNETQEEEPATQSLILETSRSPSPNSYTPASPSSSCDSMYSLSTTSPSPPIVKCIKQEKEETERLPHVHHKQTIHLWQFLKELLDAPHTFNHCIKWLDRSRGIFKIEDSSKVAKEWGRRKNRPAMNYDKLSRSIRQYYKKGIIRKTEHSKRLVYQFCQPYL